MKYIITKEECESRLSGVCSMCGKPVVAIETLDNGDNPTHWAGCNDCGRFDGGVTPEVYATAAAMVRDMHYRPYSRMQERESDDAGMKLYKEQSQISGACRTVAMVLEIHDTDLQAKLETRNAEYDSLKATQEMWRTHCQRADKYNEQLASSMMQWRGRALDAEAKLKEAGSSEQETEQCRDCVHREELAINNPCADCKPYGTGNHFERATGASNDA